MRIIGGEWGGRKIHPPSKMPYTRPTTDIAKEGLFNILQSNRELEGLENARPFWRNGQHQFRTGLPGCNRSDHRGKRHARCWHSSERQLRLLGLSQLNVVPSDVFRFLKTTKEQYDFIFAGPPYALETIDQIPELMLSAEIY